jgi:hypothetical protein
MSGSTAIVLIALFFFAAMSIMMIFHEDPSVECVKASGQWVQPTWHPPYCQRKGA